MADPMLFVITEFDCISNQLKFNLKWNVINIMIQKTFFRMRPHYFMTPLLFNRYKTTWIDLQKTNLLNPFRIKLNFLSAIFCALLYVSLLLFMRVAPISIFCLHFANVWNVNDKEVFCRYHLNGGFYNIIVLLFAKLNISSKYDLKQLWPDLAFAC